MGVPTHSQRLPDAPLQLGRPSAGSTAAAVRSASPTAPRPTPGLVLVIAASRAEQHRLLESVPEDVPVLVATSAEQAEELLHTFSPGPLPQTGPTLRAAERTVCWGDGRSVRLTPLEFALLQTLSAQPGRVWSFSELSRKVWATGFVGDGAQVRAVVKRLRRKLAEAAAPVLVETVRGAGFRLAPCPGPAVDD
jgi:hypothetical protein